MKTTIGGRSLIGLVVLAGLTSVAGCAAKPPPADPSLADGTGASSPKVSAPPANSPGPAVSGSAEAIAQNSSPAHESTLTPKPAPPADPPVATVNGLTLSTAELVRPLIEAHGLTMLLVLVQRDLARQGAETAKPPIVVTPDDFRAERERTLTELYQDADARIQDEIDKATKNKKPDEIKRWQDERETEHKQMLEQFYQQQRLSPVEFDLLMQTNTYLRKIAQPRVAGTITEDVLHKEFAARFGEMLRVRHIQLARPQDNIEIQNALAAGQKFEELAGKYSINPQTKALGGQLPAFNRDDPRLPKQFRDAAFDLKVGQVSDLVEADNSFHLIKLEERIPPKAVVYEQQREILYRSVNEQLVQAVVNQLREAVAEKARKSLKINDPAMAAQYDERLKLRTETIKGRDKAEQEMVKENDRRKLMIEEFKARRAATRPGATQPVTAPAATSQPASSQPMVVPPPKVSGPAALTPTTAPATPSHP